MALDRRQQEALTRIEHTLREDDPSLARTLDTFGVAARSRCRTAVAGALLVALALIAVLGVRAIAVIAVVLVLAAPVAACVAAERAASTLFAASLDASATDTPGAARSPAPDAVRRSSGRGAAGNGRLRAGRPPRRRRRGSLPRPL